MFNHARPQTSFLPDCNPERFLGLKRRCPGPLHFIGAVETIDTGFRQIPAALGLPRHNASGGTAPHHDGATRRLAEELCDGDFAFTGCDGENAPAAPPWAGGAPGQPVSPERPGVTALLPRAAHALTSLEIGLEHRLFYHPPLRRLA